MRALSYRQDGIGFLASFSLAALAVSFLSPQNTLYLFILFGQGHFLVTYFYQWRGGKVTSTYLFSYLILALLLFGGYVLFGFGEWLIVFTGTLFAVHFFVDEFRMARLPFSIARGLLGVAFVVPYGAFLVRSVVGFDALTPVLTISSIYLCASIVLLFYQRPWSRVDIVALIATALTPLFLLQVSPAPEYLLGFIILFHYVRWYFYYFFCLNDNPLRRRAYLWHVGVFNIIVFYSDIHLLSVPFLGYFFYANFFYLWTILHIIFSYMPSSARIPFIGLGRFREGVSA